MEFENENNKKKNKNSFVWYLITFFVGCLAMYALIRYYPVVVTEEVMRLEKDVTVNENGIADAVEKVYDAVVVVSTYKKDTYIASGSGFVYQKDGNTYHILTNYHVIENGDRITVTFTDGTVLETKISGYNEYADIAVLTIESSKDLNVASVGSSNDARVGDTTFAVGAPLDSVYSWTVSRGILSGKERMVEVAIGNSSTSDYVMKVLQTDASINAGNSGGPLCNSNGEIIGITSLKLVDDGVEGMGFAIPIEDALEQANLILAGKTIDTPYLGVGMVDLTRAYYNFNYYEIIRESGLSSGVIVTSVEKNSAAEKGGIEAGDIIIGVDDQDVNNIAYLRYYLYQHQVGDKVKIKINRKGDTKTLTVTLKSNKQTS